MADLQWNRVSSLEPSGSNAETLPLGHRVLLPYTMESGIEPGALRVQSRHLITRPPLPLICSCSQRHMMSHLGFRLCKLRLNVLIKESLLIIKKNVCVSVGWSSTG
ncbi:hypothetical protein AVEN_233441-1 [Araneus ventricosus]|uniref:Uncharacterized protein n=1 Tax=Araneus ventricosus TaxID=182803 RepID=A0A4Y2G0E4_ARAVE|nr:hypothetical protein AVEN_233441-1 [Araneus ventricosus]